MSILEGMSALADAAVGLFGGDTYATLRRPTPADQSGEYWRRPAGTTDFTIRVCFADWTDRDRERNAKIQDGDRRIFVSPLGETPAVGPLLEDEIILPDGQRWAISWVSAVRPGSATYLWDCSASLRGKA